MNARTIITGGLLIALGILLPSIFHIIGVGGPVILPMHIPIMFAGIFLGPAAAVLVGVLTPILSHLLTGMPPLAPIPILPLMVVELSIYGLMIGYLWHNLRVNIWVSLLGSMVAGRVALGLAAAVIGPLFNLPLNPLIYVQGAIVAGLPGIALQFLVIPPLTKKFFHSRQQSSVLSSDTIN